MPKEQNQSDALMRERYGIQNRKKSAWITYALLFGVIGGGWLIWSSAHFIKPEIRSNLISFNSVDVKSIDVRYSISFKNLSKTHICRLVARDYGANVVGEVTDRFAPGTLAQTKITKIPTRALAVNAGITSCQTL